MRNPRAGEFQGKGKNSTCSANLGRGGEQGRVQWGSAGVHSLISGSTRSPLCTASKAPL